jgi:hypothetical protein
MKLKLSDWASIAEILGAVAIVISLVYVGQQVRESARQTELNTNAVQAATLQGMVDLSTNYLIDTSLDREFIRTLGRAQADPGQLDEIEALQMQRIIRSQWLRYQGAYRHWQRGSLDDADWEAYIDFICAPTPNVGEGSWVTLQAEFWPGERDRLTDDFVAFVEDCRPDLAQIID